MIRRFQHGLALAAGALVLTARLALADTPMAPPARLSGPSPGAITAPSPKLASRPQADGSAAWRLKRINAVTSWGYQLAGLSLEEAANSPYELLVVDATGGLGDGKAFTRDQVERLKRMPDGRKRLVISYLSIGEAEDYRSDYFSKEYMEEEAPDWLMKENPQWKGNRLIRFCEEGWQKTILGDEAGRNVYAGDEPSPLYRLLELGFDGVYLDRVDVYSEIAKECPNGASKMVDFVVRLAAHARKKDPRFLVVLQNAEELLADSRMLTAIDGVAKESLFSGGDMSQRKNDKAAIDTAIGYLNRAKAAGRAVLVVDYVTSQARASDEVRQIASNGFVPYVAPRNLGKLWLPGVNF